MISKTKINKRIEKKTNPEVVETINLAKKNNLLDLAKKLSGPIRVQTKVNVGGLDKVEGDVLVAGKVLGQGVIKNKKKIIALGFSEQASDKLKKAGCEMRTIKQEIESNKKLEGVKVL